MAERLTKEQARQLPLEGFNMSDRSEIPLRIRLIAAGKIIWAALSTNPFSWETHYLFMNRNRAIITKDPVEVLEIRKGYKTL